MHMHTLVKNITCTVVIFKMRNAWIIGFLHALILKLFMLKKIIPIFF